MKVRQLIEILECMDRESDVLVAFKDDNPIEGCLVEEVIGITRSKEGEKNIVVIINS